jgi:hypothetical protein
MRKIATAIIVVLALAFLMTSAWATELHGVVQAMPEKGHIGEWKIDGKTVYVTEETKVKEKYGKIMVGTLVEVEGVTCNGKFIAAEIESEKRS